MLIGKQRSVPGRVAAVVFATAGVTAAGVLLTLAGGLVRLWPWPPQPSSWFGVLTGFALLAIVFFEMALLPRKWFRGARLGATKVWMALHIWVGLAGLPVVLVHAGFGLGGPLPAVTLVLFLLVTASGVWGLVMQQWLPTKILAEIPGETVASQVDNAMRYYTELDPAKARSRTAARVVDAVRTEPVGVDGAVDPRLPFKPGLAYRLVEDLITVPPEYDELISGGAAMKVVGGRAEGAPTFGTPTRNQAVVVGQPAAELEEFRDRVLLPYLRDGRRSGSPLAARAEAERRFARLRDMVPREALPAIDRLAELCDLRRQWDALTRLNFWLHNWLLFHLPLSVAMTVLMIVHAIRALKYW